MNEALKPYIARSLGLHVAALAGVLLIVPRARVKPASVYMIDFVGPSATIVSASPATPAAEPKNAARPGAVPAQADSDAIGKHSGPVALPRPSLLNGAHNDDRAPASASSNSSLAGQSTSKTVASPSSVSASAAAAGAGVATDLPNFPYPWYISQVRLMLWQSWKSRMPPLDASGAVAFSILPDGTFTDLSVESSSGDAVFDRAALASVQAAAPFPPLPRDFHEAFLKIHLTLKSETSWR